MKKAVLMVLGALAVPALALAEGGQMLTVTIIPDNVEEILEVINLVLAIAAAVSAIKLAALSQGGAMEKTWNMVAISISLFAVYEILGALEAFSIFSLGAVREVVELLFIVTLVTAFYKTRKSLLKAVLG